MSMLVSSLCAVGWMISPELMHQIVFSTNSKCTSEKSAQRPSTSSQASIAALLAPNIAGLEKVALAGQR